MLTAKQILVGRVQEIVGVYVTEQDVVVGIPTALPHGSTRNTKVVVFTQSWIPLSNGFEIYYDRIHLSQLKAFALKKTNCLTTYDILEVMNNTLEYNFSIDDIEETALPIPDGDDEIVFLPKLKASSLGFYDSAEITQTVSEYDDPLGPILPIPLNPENPSKPLSVPVPPDTYIREECINGDLVELYTDEYGGLYSLMTEVGSASCDLLTLEVLTPTTQGVPSKFAVCSYKFNKLTGSALTFKTRKFNTFGNYLTSNLIQYKLEDSDRWESSQTNGDIIIPAGTLRFSIRVMVKETDVANQFLYLVEKRGMTSLVNTEPLIVEIMITETSDPIPPIPPLAGIAITTYCHGVNEWGTYEDGLGGTYNNLIEEKSATCGYIQKPTLSADLDAVTISQSTPLVITYTLDLPTVDDLLVSVGLTHITTVSSAIDTIEFMSFSQGAFAPVSVGSPLTVPAGDLTFTLRIVFKPTTIVDEDKYVIVKIAEFGAGGMLTNTEGIPTNTTVTL